MMETIKNGTCLFCMKPAQESWSDHNRCFDGYYCDCEGRKKLDEALKPARDNLAELKRKEEKKARKAEKKRLKERLAQL